MIARSTTSELKLQLQDVPAASMQSASEITPKQISASDFIQVDLMARGGCSTVHSGWYAGQKVAIKHVTTEPPTDIHFKSQQVEIMTELQQLHAPHVIQLIAFTDASIPYYLIMPLMVNDSLYFQLLHNSAQPFRHTLCLKILIGVAEALAFMHKNCIIHCDVKPGNVLLDKNNEPYVTDFDSATRFESIYPISELGASYRGTLMYMAPEVIHKKHFTTSSDVYSFSIMFWELLAWQFAGKALDEMPDFVLLHKIVKGYRENIPENWPTNLARLIHLGWQEQEKERPSMQAVHDELVQHENKMKL